MRLGDWEVRLAVYLEAKAGESFAWGANDCAMFAAGAVEAVTGVDPIPHMRGAYDSEFGAARVIVEKGAGTLEGTIDSLFDECPIGFARRGDLVWNGESVGVCNGHLALFIGEIAGQAGLVASPRLEWRKAWAVG
jgi:hypothetical protein